ncbi:ATP-binding protein [Streptomyces anthocyanicus]|uniref:ATP-binding protein n=1 Tax=Streptomyces anthocyanicus TaxID=68174 RepID=UPI002F91A9DF|nr:ATP-binding protein [Streptomyces anthocyanicus]WTE24007.1 ATP-binding protein [Streptomyces anthocyanicus]
MTTMAATVAAGGTRTWAFPRRAEFIPETRHHVEALLRAWQRPAETVDAAMLLVTELVTNAVEHTDASDVICSVRLSAEVVTVSVTDTGTGSNTGGVPVPAQPDDLAESGRGLFLVAALATDWGTRVTAGSREVWASLAG